MNYTSFIGKIIKKPKRQFIDNDIPITKIKKNEMCVLIELKLRELNLKNEKIYFDEN